MNTLEIIVLTTISVIVLIALTAIAFLILFEYQCLKMEKECERFHINSEALDVMDDTYRTMFY